MAPLHGHVATPSCAAVHGASRTGSLDADSRAVQRRSGTTVMIASLTNRALVADGSGPRYRPPSSRVVFTTARRGKASSSVSFR